MIRRRTPLRARKPWRRKPSKAKRRSAGRPGRPVDMGKRWRQRAQEIRERDSGACRHCGHAVGMKQGPVDHLIPRRLFQKDEDANFSENLCTLCGRCHRTKTHEVEPALYSGNVQRFRRFLQVVSWSGPIPSEERITTALLRVTEALRKA